LAVDFGFGVPARDDDLEIATLMSGVGVNGMRDEELAENGVLPVLELPGVAGRL
jgi:hypothetical protein